MSQETFTTAEAPRNHLSDILDRGYNTLDVVIAENDRLISEASLRLQRSQNLQPVYHELKNELDGLLHEYVAVEQAITLLQARKGDQEATLQVYQQEIDAGYEHQEQLGRQITDVERLGLAMANGKDFWIDSKGDRHDVSAEEQQDFFSDPQLPDSPQKRLVAERARYKAELERVKAEIETLIVSRYEARQIIVKIDEELEPLLQKQREFRLTMSALEAKIAAWQQGVNGLAGFNEYITTPSLPVQKNVSLSGTDSETIVVSQIERSVDPAELPVFVESLPYAPLDVGRLQALGRPQLRGMGVQVVVRGTER